MQGTSNANKTVFYYNGSGNQRVGKHSDVVMQRKTNIGGQKHVVFERVANGSFREKIDNFFTGLRRASPNKMQQFFESRGLTKTEAHRVTSNILDKGRSAISFDLALYGHQSAARGQLPDK
ncbi:MAG: hypothetical protein EBW14_02090 [Oxalobacteraceae bacterium]|nr:hypothetical protein [Oxalobacteraceae bacterium]